MGERTRKETFRIAGLGMLGWDIDSGKWACWALCLVLILVFAELDWFGLGDVRGSDDTDKLSGPLTGKTGRRVKLVVRSAIGLFAPGFLAHVMDCRARPTWLGNSPSAKYYSILFRQSAMPGRLQEGFHKT